MSTNTGDQTECPATTIQYMFKYIKLAKADDISPQQGFTQKPL